MSTSVARQVGTVIDVHGVCTRVESTGRKFTLQELYQHVGCNIVERVRVGRHFVWVDEMGKLNGKPVNAAATALCHGKLMLGDCIVGTALVIPALD